MKSTEERDRSLPHHNHHNSAYSRVHIGGKNSHPVARSSSFISAKVICMFWFGH